MKRRSARVAQEVVDALEGERQRITQQLHDGLCQTLTGLTFQLESLRGGDVQGHELAGMSAFHRRVESLRESMRTAVREANLLHQRLAPLDRGPESLVQGLEKLAQEIRRKLPCELIVEEAVLDGMQGHEASTAFYRIAQEAVGNALRRPHVEHLCIQLRRQRNALQLEITDDGAEATEQVNAESHALMQCYADARGAHLTIKVSPQEGNLVRCTLPLELSLELSELDPMTEESAC